MERVQPEKAKGGLVCEMNALAALMQQTTLEAAQALNPPFG
jgi:hypothetical protein